MKKIITLLLVLILTISLCACAQDFKSSSGENFKYDELALSTDCPIQLVLVYSSNDVTKGKIYMDVETRVLYYHGYQNMTILVDAEGKPLLYDNYDWD